MTSLFAQDLIDGLDTLLADAGETVEYRRGALTVTITQAVPLWKSIPQTKFDPSTGSFVSMGSSQTRDWLVKATDIVLDGNVELPKEGDRIVETDSAGVGWHHEVMKFRNDPVFVYLDPDRKFLRIHSKFTKNE